jgi:hypothetical protein
MGSFREKKRLKGILCLFVFACIFLLLGRGNWTKSSWFSTALDSGSVFWCNSIAVDSKNKIHISYYDVTNDDLKYATNVSGSWTYETLSTRGGRYNFIAIDSNDKVHISYRDWNNYLVKYVTNASGSWVTTTVASSETGHSFWGDTDIAIDLNNDVHIAYMDWNGSQGFVKYAMKNSDGSWTTTTIDSAGTQIDPAWVEISIAVDSNNKVHISYQNLNLKYATNAPVSGLSCTTSGSWNICTVDSGDTGYDNQIAIDSNDKVHISYTYNTGKDLKYATNASGNWVTTTIDSGGDVGWMSSIAIDSNDKVHISYLDYTNKKQKYTTNAGGSWATITLLDSSEDTTYGCGGSGVAIDSNNNVHISYHGNNNTEIRYAYKRRNCLWRFCI